MSWLPLARTTPRWACTALIEIRVADPDTQCDNNPDWLVDIDEPSNYAGLLEFGQMEESGFFSMAGYDFE